MRQILTNLLSNAIKFTPEGGRVRLIVRLRDRDTVEIVVEDTGIGIPLHEQDTIFEKFRQGNRVPGQEDAITREYEGTGLGLSIVRELSKLLGGEVQLESEFGKGSTFIVSLPIRVPVDLREAEPPGIDHIAEEFVGMNRIASREYDSPVEPPVESDTDIDESDPEPRADDSAA